MPLAIEGYGLALEQLIGQPVIESKLSFGTGTAKSPRLWWR